MTVEPVEKGRTDAMDLKLHYSSYFLLRSYALCMERSCFWDEIQFIQDVSRPKISNTLHHTLILSSIIALLTLFCIQLDLIRSEIRAVLSLHDSFDVRLQNKTR